MQAGESDELLPTSAIAAAAIADVDDVGRGRRRRRDYATDVASPPVNSVSGDELMTRDRLSSAASLQSDEDEFNAEVERAPLLGVAGRKRRSVGVNDLQSDVFAAQATHRGARAESLYEGGDHAAKQLQDKENLTWEASMKLLESLDYDEVDNEVARFKMQGRKRHFYGYSGTTLVKWVITVLVGIITGFLAYGVESAVEAIVKQRQRLLQHGLDQHLLTGLLYSILASATLVGLSCLMTVTLAPAASGSGVALIMSYLNGVHIPKLLAPRTLLTKIVGTIFAVSSGLPVGPEGPLVHIGSGVAAFFTRQHSIGFGKTKVSTHNKWLDLFHNDHDRREFISSGAAAGLAAAFGAPIGGVLFSLEEASSFWSQRTTWRSMLCATVATFVLALGHGHKLQLQSPGLLSFQGLEPRFNLIEIPVFLLIAVAGGLFGALFSSAYVIISKTRPKTRSLKVLEAVLTSMVVTAVAVLVPSAIGICQRESLLSDPELGVRFFCSEGEFNDLGTLLFGSREGVIESLLAMEGKHETTFTIQSIAIFLGIFLVLTSLSYGIALPSGLFMPAILAGSLFGGLIGRGVYAFAQDHFDSHTAANIQPGLYALIGGVSFLGGIFRSSISLVVIVLEGTGVVAFLLPIVLAVVISKFVADSFNHSVYDALLFLKTIPFLHHEAPESIRNKTAQDIMSSPAVCFNEYVQVGDLVDQLRDCTHNGFPVTRTEQLAPGKTRQVYMGTILRSQLLVLLSRRAFQNHPTASREVTDTDVFLHQAMSTYHHRHHHFTRFASSDQSKVEHIGIRPYERTKFITLTPFINIAPVTVQERVSADRVFRQFRTMGLRHLVVTDLSNVPVGIITRTSLADHHDADKQAADVETGATGM